MLKFEIKQRRLPDAIGDVFIFTLLVFKKERVFIASW